MPRKTDTQERIYQYLQWHILAHGYGPTCQEIADALDLHTTSTVYGHLRRLQSKGLIRMDRRIARSITLKGGKMRNIDAFNAMSREGQRNVLIQQLEGWDFLSEESIEAIVDDFLDWLYSPAE